MWSRNSCMKPVRIFSSSGSLTEPSSAYASGRKLM